MFLSLCLLSAAFTRNELTLSVNKALTNLNVMYSYVLQTLLLKTFILKQNTIFLKQPILFNWIYLFISCIWLHSYLCLQLIMWCQWLYLLWVLHFVFYESHRKSWARKLLTLKICQFVSSSHICTHKNTLVHEGGTKRSDISVISDNRNFDHKYQKFSPHELCRSYVYSYRVNQQKPFKLYAVHLLENNWF